MVFIIIINKNYKYLNNYFQISFPIKYQFKDKINYNQFLNRFFNFINYNLLNFFNNSLFDAVFKPKIVDLF